MKRSTPSQEHFYSLTLTEHDIPGAPQLTLRVQDNDFFSSDDYLGKQLKIHLKICLSPAEKQDHKFVL